MTDRLHDLVDSDDPAVAELAQLVRAASDLEPSPGAQERVRSRLTEPSPRRRWSRPPVLVLLLVTLVTSAVVAGVRTFVARAPERVDALEPAPQPERAAEPPRRRRAIPSAEALPAAEPPPPAEPPPVEPPPAEPPPRSAYPRVVSSPAPSPVPGPPAPESPAPSPVPGPPAEDPPAPNPPSAKTPLVRSSAPSVEAELVLRALHLLRHDHDVTGALRLLDDYGARFPAGDLAEEALALAIEARAALDDAAARSLAEQYLERFPHGRFRALAEQARRRFHDH
jgi:outer membrane biosynthesis protein TonB